MVSNTPNPYLRTKILTATPEELRLMLYEGALKFCRQGHAALEAKDFEASYSALMRAQKIVLELSTSLNHKAAPDLCDKLSALYSYLYRRLVDANFSRDAAIVSECVQLLEYERETWQLLMQRLNQHPDGAVASEHASITGAHQTALSSLSTQA